MFKKGKRRKDQEGAQSSNKSLTRVIVAVFAAVLVWIGAVALESYVLTDKSVTSVVVAKTDIVSGALINADNAGSMFTLKTVNADLITERTITSPDQLYGKAVTDISAGEIMTTNRIFNTAWVNEKYENPVEVSFGVAGASAAVNGTIRSGDLVNIMTLESDGNGSYVSKVLMENVYIIRAYTSSFGLIASNDRGSIATNFVIYVEDTEAEKLNGILATGSVYLAKLENK